MAPNDADDQQAIGDLEAATGLEWVKSRRKEKVAKFAAEEWDDLEDMGLNGRQREGLLELLEAAAGR